MPFSAFYRGDEESEWQERSRRRVELIGDQPPPATRLRQPDDVPLSMRNNVAPITPRQGPTQSSPRDTSMAEDANFVEEANWIDESG